MIYNNFKINETILQERGISRLFAKEELFKAIDEAISSKGSRLEGEEVLDIIWQFLDYSNANIKAIYNTKDINEAIETLYSDLSEIIEQKEEY